MYIHICIHTHMSTQRMPNHFPGESSEMSGLSELQSKPEGAEGQQIQQEESEYEWVTVTASDEGDGGEGGEGGFLIHYQDTRAHCKQLINFIHSTPLHYPNLLRHRKRCNLYKCQVLSRGGGERRRGDDVDAAWW